MPRAVLAAAVLALLSGGCGGGDTAEEASDAVAALVASEDCVRLMDVAAAVPRALGGVVGSGARPHSAFLAEFSTRAPRELTADVTVVQSALGALAGGQELAASQDAPVRASADRIGAWARSSCPR